MSRPIFCIVVWVYVCVTVVDVLGIGLRAFGMSLHIDGGAAVANLQKRHASTAAPPDPFPSTYQTDANVTHTIG